MNKNNFKMAFPCVLSYFYQVNQINPNETYCHATYIQTYVRVATRTDTLLLSTTAYRSGGEIYILH